MCKVHILHIGYIYVGTPHFAQCLLMQGRLPGPAGQARDSESAIHLESRPGRDCSGRYHTCFGPARHSVP
jgi:hypothetical protein